MGLPVNITAQSKLDPAAQQAFELDYTARKKSLLIAYLLCLIGWHYLYLGKFGLQFLFWITLGGFLVWGLVDLLRLPGMVRRQNEEIAWDLLPLYQTRAEPFGPLADFLT